jgi:hypothetical protein
METSAMMLKRFRQRKAIPGTNGAGHIQTYAFSNLREQIDQV